MVNAIDNWHACCDNVPRQARRLRLEISFVQIKHENVIWKSARAACRVTCDSKCSRVYRSIDPNERQDFDSPRYAVEYSRASTAPRREVALLLARARATSARDKNPAVRRRDRFINVMSRFCGRLNSHAPLYPPHSIPSRHAALVRLRAVCGRHPRAIRVIVRCLPPRAHTRVDRATMHVRVCRRVCECRPDHNRSSEMTDPMLRALTLPRRGWFAWFDCPEAEYQPR